MQIPTELIEKIYYDYIPLYMTKLGPIHAELLDTRGIFLRLTNHRFDFHVDSVTFLPSSFDIKGTLRACTCCEKVAKNITSSPKCESQGRRP